MKRILSAVIAFSMFVSLAQVDFNATSETLNITQKSQSTTITVGNTQTEKETNTNLYAMNASIDGNSVSMYPIISIGTAGTYAKTYLPEGMNTKDVLRLISYAKAQGYAKINSATNAVGDMSLTSSDDLDIAITLAMWGKYRYNMDTTNYIDFDRNASNKYVKAAKYIVDNYNSHTLAETTFDVNSANIKTIAHTDSDYKYYGPFNFTSNNSSIACAELNGGVKIADSKWSVVDENSLTAGTNYYIAVPTTSVNQSISVKLSLQYVDQDVVVYGNTAAKFIGVVNTPFKLNETLTISSYATVKIYDSPGNIVNVRSEDGVYDKNIIIGANGVGYAENISIGNYTIKQVATADGLVLNTNPKTISITSTSDIAEVKFDTISLYGTLQINNISNTGTTLNGGVLEIFCSDGSLFKTITMQDTVSISMPIGNYFAKQSTAVNGYQINSTKYSFTISPNKLTELKIVNAVVGSNNDSINANKGNGSITVYTQKDGILSNSQDVILSGNGIFLQGTPVEGIVKFSGLPIGSYTVYLTNLPAGYSEASSQVVIPNADSAVNITLNTIKTNNISNYMFGLVVVDEYNYVIPNMKTDVFNKDTGAFIGSIITDANGYSNLTLSSSGTYVLKFNSSDYKSEEYTVAIPNSTNMNIKAVLLRSNDNVTLSNKLPLLVTDSVYDNNNTGVTNSKEYNSFDGDNKFVIDGDSYYIVENNSDFDGRVRIIVNNPKGKAMSDVTVSLYNSKDKKLFTGDTNKDGELLLAGLEPKKEYHITLKSSTLNEYLQPKEDDLIFTTTSNKTTKFVIDLLDEEETSNDVQLQSSLVITTQNSSGEKITAKYSVYNSVGTLVTSGETVNGVATFMTDEVGTFTVKQTSVQDGYVLEKEPYTFTITDTPRTISVTVTNEKENKLFSLKGIVFEDKNSNNLYDSGEEYSQAKITVSDGSKTISVYSSAAGEFTVTDLPKGTYTVQANLPNVQFLQQNVGDNDADNLGKVVVDITDSNITNLGIGFTVKNSTTQNTSDGQNTSVGKLPQTGNPNNSNALYIMYSVLCIISLVLLNKKSKNF